jgi:hypothetical protein
MVTRATERVRRLFGTEETTPAEELAETRGVAPGAEVSGLLLPEHLTTPAGLGPDWAPLLQAMRVEMATEVAGVVRDLLAEDRPLPLSEYANGTDQVVSPFVPVATLWEITHLHLVMAAGDAAVFEGTGDTGLPLDQFTVPAAGFYTAPYTGVWVGSGRRLVVTGAGAMQLALSGRVHSTRPGAH